MIASLGQLLEFMRHHGASRVYAKRLSPNDNSKNQVYLGGDFSALNIIPHGDIYTDITDVGGAIRDRAKADVRFFWVDESGLHPAPGTNLILYPRYPEVRMSGFLRQCPGAPADIMRARDPGRTLILGITPDGNVLGYAAGSDSPVSAELISREWSAIGVFLELPLSPDHPGASKARLLNELRRIAMREWIASQKLSRDGTKTAYQAPNGGGYTLEAELGISPNGNAEPDFLGWEVKQYGVRDFVKFRPRSPVTLMTPDPTGGIYVSGGFNEFLRRYGYPDQSGKQDRYNFGGRYDCLTPHNGLTGLRMVMTGYDAASGKISDLDGGLALIDATEEVAALWTFKRMMAHWNRKHAQAAYVPSLFRTPPPEYRYGAHVLLCEQTDFLLFLKAFGAGKVYYDPGMKIENASSASPTTKRRSQFRVAHADLTQLYHRHETVIL